MRSPIALVAASVWAASAHAQLVPYDARALGAEAGLPAGPVFGFAEDREGFVWMATRDGAVRYDGERTLRFSLDEPAEGGPPPNIVLAMHVDREGRLWAGTAAGTLARFDPEQGAFVAHPRPRSGDSTPGEAAIEAIVEDGRGRLWLSGRAGGGLYRFDPEREAYARLRLDTLVRAPRAPLRVAVDEAGDVWAGLLAPGVIRVAAGGDRARRLPRLPGVASPYRDDVAGAVAARPGGDLWAGLTGGAVAAYDRGAGRFVVYPNPHVAPDAGGALVSELAPGAGGTWWVGTQDERLFRFTPETGRYGPVALPADAPPDWASLDPYVDREGRLWLLSVRGPIGVVDSSGAWVPLEGEALRTPATRLFQDSRGRYWLAPPTGGVLTFRLREAGERTGALRLPIDPRTPAYSLLEDRGGDVWVGTADGLLRVDADGHVRERFAHGPDGEPLPGPALALAETPRGEVWAGTPDGPARYDPARRTFEVHLAEREGGQGGRPHVRALHADGGGALWVYSGHGSRAALGRHGPASGAPLLGPERGPASGGARSDDRLGAHAVGLLRTARVRPEALAEPVTHRGRSGTAYALAGAVLARVDGRDVAGGPRPALVLTEAVVPARGGAGRQALHGPWPRRPVRLAHNERSLTLRFSDLDYDASAAAREFEVRVRPMSTAPSGDWTPTGRRRSVTLTDLGPGRYTVEVRRVGTPGPEAGVGVVVAPPPWRTPWAGALALGAVGALAGAVVRARARRRRVEEGLRRQIADDLHDEVGGRLGALALHVEMAAQDGRLDVESRSRLTEAAEAARAASAGVRDAVWALDGGGLTAAALADRMESVAHEALRAVDHAVDRPPSAPAAPLAPGAGRDVLLALREALHNAVRHAHARRVEVRIVADGRAVGFEVRDDGHGIGPNAGATGGRGLRTMRERAERRGGRCSVTSAPGRGTSVRFEVPASGEGA